MKGSSKEKIISCICSGRFLHAFEDEGKKEKSEMMTVMGRPEKKKCRHQQQMRRMRHSEHHLQLSCENK